MTGLNRLLSRGIVLAVLVLVPVAARGQGLAASFDDLQRVINTGDTVVVSDETGRKTKGKVAGVSEASLVLDVRKTQSNPTGKLAFDQTGVGSIVRRDSVENGALFGLGAGAIAAWTFTRLNCGPAGHDPECSAIAGAIGIVVFVPSGLVAGWLIDRSINKTVFQSSGRGGVRTSIAISPILGKTTRGVGASIGF